MKFPPLIWRFAVDLSALRAHLERGLGDLLNLFPLVPAVGADVFVRGHDAVTGLCVIRSAAFHVEKTLNIDKDLRGRAFRRNT